MRKNKMDLNKIIEKWYKQNKTEKLINFKINICLCLKKKFMINIKDM